MHGHLAAHTVTRAHIMTLKFCCQCVSGIEMLQPAVLFHFHLPVQDGTVKPVLQEHNFVYHPIFISQKIM